MDYSKRYNTTPEEANDEWFIGGLNYGAFTDAYWEAAFWSSNWNDTGFNFDESPYTFSDLADETWASMKKDCRDFMNKNKALLKESGMSDSQAGHDFWLTRAGHGCGYWDRGLGEIGKKLTAASKEFKEQDMYVGDDDKIYIT